MNFIHLQLIKRFLSATAQAYQASLRPLKQTIYIFAMEIARLKNKAVSIDSEITLFRGRSISSTVRLFFHSEQSYR